MRHVSQNLSVRGRPCRLTTRSRIVGNAIMDAGRTGERGMMPGSVVDARYAATAVMTNDTSMTHSSGIPTMGSFRRRYGNDTAHSPTKMAVMMMIVSIVPR